MLPIFRLIPVGGLFLAIAILLLALNPPQTTNSAARKVLPARGALLDRTEHPEWRQFLFLAAWRRADEVERLRELHDTMTRTEVPSVPNAAEPKVAEAAPAVVAPKTATTAPADVAPEINEPAATAPSPIAAPKPIAAEPKVAEAAPAVVAPKAAEAAAIAHAPKVAEPAPVEPTPEAVQPKPVAAEPKIAAVTPIVSAPAAPTPAPVAAKPESVAPAPTQVASIATATPPEAKAAPSAPKHDIEAAAPASRLETNGSRAATEATPPATTSAAKPPAAVKVAAVPAQPAQSDDDITGSIEPTADDATIPVGIGEASSIELQVTLPPERPPILRRLDHARSLMRRRHRASHPKKSGPPDFFSLLFQTFPADTESGSAKKPTIPYQTNNNWKGSNSPGTSRVY